MKKWTWAQERAATILWLRTVAGLGTGCRGEIKRLANQLEAGEHLQELGELLPENSSPSPKRSAK